MGQDQVIVESQRPEEIPTDLREELHLKVPDASGIAYRRLLGLTLGLVGLSGLGPAAGADWPHLRGPRYDGTSADKGLADVWPAGGPAWPHCAPRDPAPLCGASRGGVTHTVQLAAPYLGALLIALALCRRCALRPGTPRLRHLRQYGF